MTLLNNKKTNVLGKKKLIYSSLEPSYNKLCFYSENYDEDIKSSNYAFIKGPKELIGLSIDDPEAKKIILDWLEKERSMGNTLVGAMFPSLSWLFLVTPNSIRFIKDE